MISVTAEKFAATVSIIAQSLNDHIDDIEHIDEFVGFLNLCACLDPSCVTIEHWRSLLPLSETMTSLHRLFKQTVAPGNPSLLTAGRKKYLFGAVHLYCAALEALFTGDILLQDGWKRGELYRVLSGIALALDYISHPLGMIRSLKATFETATMASTEEKKDIETSYEFTLRSLVDMVRPLLILNKMFTGSGLPLGNPELELLRRNVLKQELVAGTVITLCQAMAYGVQGKYIQHCSTPWERFLQVWQYVPNGAGFPELATSCGRAVLQMEHSIALWLLIFSTNELGIRLDTGEEIGAAESGEWKRQGPHVDRLLEFICSWATMISLGINWLSEEENEGRGGGKGEQVEEQTGGGIRSSLPLQSAAFQRAISELKTELAIDRSNDGIESCRRILRLHRKELRSRPGIDVTATAAAASLSVLRLSTCLYSSEGFPPKIPVFEELCTASESWVSLMHQVFEFIESSPLGIAPSAAALASVDSTELLSDAFTVALLKAESFLERSDADKWTVLVIPAFRASESLFAAHAVMCRSLSRWPELAEEMQFLYNPLSKAMAVAYILMHALYNLTSEEMPPQQYRPIIKAAANAVQAACKSSLEALALPQPLLLSVYPVRESSVSSILGVLILPQFAFFFFSDLLDSAGESLQREYAAKRTALLLQLLKVIASIPNEMEKQLETLAKESLGAFDLLNFWASGLSSELPAVCWEPEPGLDKVVWLLTLNAQTRDLAHLHGSLASLTELIAKLEAGPSDVDATVKQRALVLSNLQCANLSCSNVRFPWEKKKPMVCSGCKKARYCSEACQKADWKAHKRACQLLAKERKT